MSDVIFTSHRREVVDEMLVKKVLALSAIGEKAEEYAKKQCPVDTGRLMNSISYNVDDDTVYIGTNVKYAPKMEYTDMYHKGGRRAHFLKDAATTHGNEYKDLAKKAMS